MTINGMSVGRDYSLSVYDPDSGQIIDLGDVQNVRIHARKHDLKNQPYNDDPVFGYVPDGYAISFTMVRKNATLENWQLNNNLRFSQGQRISGGILNETISEADGSTSKYQYQNFVFFVTDIGDISRDAAVRMQAEGLASRKVPLSN